MLIAILLIVLAVFVLSLVAGLRRGDASAADQAMKTFGESVQAEFRNQRDEVALQSRHLREELDGRYKNLSDSLLARMHENLTLQNSQFAKLETRFESLEKKLVEHLSKLDANVRDSLEKIRHDNTAKLEDMRKTVDEKLQSTLEKRLGDSFKLVSERLEQVHKGLGEMQNLAAGVGDLKKALTNVKTRGVMGEYQLEFILEQLLTPDQYRKNVSTRPGSKNFVEFAIVLPGRDDSGASVLLPIDAKFPTEDYNALQEAYEKADPVLIDKFRKQISARIVSSAKDIRDKYLEPPCTTDFGIMFLPIEGLFAEVLREPGLMETLQRDYHVTIAGPTTLSAFLNSLQMGFRTLAIEKRSSEVWKILGAVKTEFGKFGDVLEKTRRKLEEASSVIEGAGVRSRAIERKLRDVQQLPAAEAQGLLALDDSSDMPVDE
ncbi:MAG: DNA recombination protein RmuC [Deltaproteobacteria bacterium]|nr:DNA recombination protein RmuC [Deltaproteobacteria bacterium]